jgi:hypothetical protein
VPGQTKYWNVVDAGAEKRERNLTKLKISGMKDKIST